jgi:hypothetical protein
MLHTRPAVSFNNSQNVGSRSNRSFKFPSSPLAVRQKSMIPFPPGLGHDGNPIKGRTTPASMSMAPASGMNANGKRTSRPSLLPLPRATRRAPPPPPPARLRTVYISPAPQSPAPSFSSLEEPVPMPLDELNRKRAIEQREARAKIVAGIMLYRLHAVGKPMKRRSLDMVADEVTRRPHIRSGLSTVVSAAVY